MTPPETACTALGDTPLAEIETELREGDGLTEAGRLGRA